MYLSAHTNLGKHLVTENRSRHKTLGFHGLGGIITNDAIGPTVSTTINGAYSYHIKISKGKITKKRSGTFASLGVMGGINQFSLDASKLVAADAGDGLITSSSKIALGDITLGAWIYSDKFYIGASLAQVAPTVAVTRTGELADYSLTNHYFVMAGYGIPLGYNFKLIPSVCIKGTTPAPLSFDINAKIRYKDFLWGGMSYRNTDAVAIMLGVVVDNKFDISYSYDYITSDINRYTGGSHEIVIGYRLIKQCVFVCPSNFW
jgi:type IX secretion system PorP/SprF family membrane protein